MKDILDKSVDMILCDLPYGTTACKWDTIIPFEPFGYICPKCASSTDISYPVKNIKQVHDFFDSLELYSFGRLIMKSEKKEKNKNK